MKILIFNWKDLKHPYAGGAEVNIHEQAKRWVKSGHYVTQFSPKFEGARISENIDGVHIIRRGGRFSIYLLVFFYYITRLRKKADVIIDIENGIPFFTPFYSLKPKIIIMHHVHQDVFFKELPSFIAWIPYLLERYIMKLAYRNIRFVAVSGTTKSEMKKRLGISSNVNVIYNGLEHTHFITNAKKSKKPTIIYFGRLMRYKRIDLLIDLFPKILEKLPNAELHIAGTGVVENELKLKVKNMKLNKKIIFHGFVDDLKKVSLLKNSWVFVNPSSLEGWGVTVIEANALGVPAIAFNVPGLSEAIRNNETGYLVKDNDEMINKIILILKDKKLRNKLGNNALNWSKNFSWDKSANETLKILEEIRWKN